MGEIVRGKRTRTMKPVCKEDRAEAVPCELDSTLTNLILQPKSDKIARPPNAFMLFAREHRKALAVKYPEQTNKVISSMLGKCWQKMDPSSKNQYYTKAKMMQQLHKQKYPGYVYSPRIARMRKLEKQSNRKTKNHTKGLRLKCKEKSDNNIIRDETVGEEVDVEPKPSSSGYIPNNPLLFSEAKSELNSVEPETTSLHSTDRQVYHIPEWGSPPSFSTSSSGRLPEEFGMIPPSDSETFYHRQTMRSECRCEACVEHKPSYCYGPPRWTPYEMDYMKEYAEPGAHRNKYYGPPSYRSPLFSRYQHYPPSSWHEINPPYQYICGPFQDCKANFCSLSPHYMKWKISPEDQARTHYRNMDDCDNYPTGFSPESRRVITPTSSTGSYNSSFDTRSRQRQVGHSGSHIDDPHFRELDYRNMHSGQIIHSVAGSTEDLSSQKIDAGNSEMNVNMPQYNTDTTQPYCRDSGSNAFSRCNNSYDGESNPSDQNLQKIDSSCLQANEISPSCNSDRKESAYHELESNNQRKSEGTTTYFSHGSEGFFSRGFEYQNAYHSDDEIINVVDVVEDVDQNNGAVVKEEIPLDEQTVSDIIQRD